MKQESLLLSTILLTISSLLVRTIGMVSMVFLSKYIGSEGLGIYELTMSLYMTALVFAYAGISTSVSRLVAEELGKNKSGNVSLIMRVAFSIALTVSVIVSILLFFNAKWLTLHFVHDTTATTALRFLAISIPFSACSSCFKGYFYATRKTIYPASSDILEQIVKLILIIFLIKTYSPYGLSYTYGAVGLGLATGEVISWSYLCSLFIIEVRRNAFKHVTSTKPTLTIKEVSKKFLNILLPIAMISYIGHIFLSVENILIPAGFKRYNEPFSSSMSLYGMVRGMVLPILFFPSAFLTAFSTTLIPEIAKSNTLGQHARVKLTCKRVLQLTFILSLLVVAIFLTYGDELGFVIYKSNELGPLLKSLTIIIPFIYAEVIADGVLKGVNEQVSCLKYSLLDSALRIVLIYFLLPIKGAHALVAIMIISCIFTSTLSFNRLLHVIALRFDLTNWLLKPAIAAGFACTYSRLIVSYCFKYSLGLTTKVFLGIAFSCIIYFPLLLLIHAINQSDLQWIKKHLAFSNLSQTS